MVNQLPPLYFKPLKHGIFFELAIIHIESGIKRFLYTQIAYYPYFLFVLVLGSGPKKGPKINLLEANIFIFKYFPKVSSEINSSLPLYPILIPKNTYVKTSLH